MYHIVEKRAYVLVLDQFSTVPKVGFRGLVGLMLVGPGSGLQGTVC